MTSRVRRSVFKHRPGRSVPLYSRHNRTIYPRMYILCANIYTAPQQRRRGRFTVPPDASRSSNNFSEHKSSARPEGSWPGHPRIIAKRYCLGSIDLAYKMLGYLCRLCVVRSEGGPTPTGLEFRWSPSRISPPFSEAYASRFQRLSLTLLKIFYRKILSD